MGSGKRALAEAAAAEADAQATFLTVVLFYSFLLLSMHDIYNIYM